MNRALFKLLLVGAALVLLGPVCGKKAAPLADGGLWKSSDGGETWEQKIVLPTAKGVSSIGRVDAIEVRIDPTDRKTIYMGTLENGLLVSYNFGDSWQINTDIKSGAVRDVAIDPKDRCNIYVAWGRKIMSTKDCTRTWKELYSVPLSDVDVRVLKINPAASSVLYAGLSNGNLLYTSDSGANWRKIKEFPSRIVDVIINPNRPTIMYVSTISDGLRRSFDSGAKWEDLRPKMESAASGGKPTVSAGYAIELDPSQDGTIYYATKVGILRSIDDGESWEIVPILSSPGEARIYDLAINPTDSTEIYYSAILGVRPVLYKSSDSGTTWNIKKIPTTRVPLSISIDPEESNVIYTGTYYREVKK